MAGLTPSMTPVCFGVQAGIEYGMPEFVPMTPFKVSDPVRRAYHVVDIPDSDSETVNGPVGTEMDIEKDPSEPTTKMDTTEWIKNLRLWGHIFPASCLSLELRFQEAENQIAALQAELAKTNRHFHLSRQARQLETARVNRLATKVAQIRGTLEVQQRGPHSPDHETETMPESSLHGQRNTASHEIIGNFMAKMTELLEATLANQRGDGYRILAMTRL
ncbi:hypothetical protein M9H77_26926 [Catharanthus roseus]|uniref:Uncharacterized protein n=1 Tax=Catharanthus roseus TaxID=4058 RepID=A0ACC0AFA5_CATRO|nr:hypothetical protein M9H77_26926 [Catharanthus roseus]